MSGEQNRFEFRSLDVFLGDEEQMPQEVSFGELVHRISLAGDVSLVAWSEGTGHERQWILNPKDKTAKRKWTDEDQLVVIRRASAFSNPVPEDAFISPTSAGPEVEAARCEDMVPAPEPQRESVQESG